MRDGGRFGMPGRDGGVTGARIQRDAGGEEGSDMDLRDVSEQMHPGACIVENVGSVSLSCQVWCRVHNALSLAGAGIGSEGHDRAPASSTNDLDRNLGDRSIPCAKILSVSYYTIV
ncbi:hypothetical protein F5141DRAFT_1067773 [Pisolithus sp. B1]|nr:hypothetical protein F5141DRAFT_1067773 [Pisolithus sp. B1]